jgi:hypothetical protein
MVVAIRLARFRQSETLAVDLYRRLSTRFGALGSAPERRPQPSQAKASAKSKTTMLKGYGNPVVMRRLIDSDDEHDDFLVEGGGQEEELKLAPEPKPSTKSVLSQPIRTRIQTAEFISSCTKVEDCPQDGLPEFAIIGRSNVGKSSLINLLTKCKNLALTSKQPGISSQSYLLHVAYVQ